MTYQPREGHGSHSDRRISLVAPVMSPYYNHFTNSSGSSQSSSHSPTSPHDLPNFYMSSRDQHVPPPPMWNFAGEDHRRQQYPAMPMAGPSRRISVVSVGGPYVHNQHNQRRISLPKYQNMPASNYLQVQSINHFDTQGSNDVFMYPTSRPKPRKYSDSTITIQRQERSSSWVKSQLPKYNKRSKSQSSFYDNKHSIGEEIIPSPEFQFNSSDLPLRPPSIEETKKLSSDSVSDSTPENQRGDSQQIIKKDTSGENKSIFSKTSIPIICVHEEKDLCKGCNNKIDTQSVTPTLTIRDAYTKRRPIKRSPLACTCGTVCGFTLLLGVAVMLFIAAFIVYIETVLKHQNPVMETM